MSTSGKCNVDDIESGKIRQRLRQAIKEKGSYEKVSNDLGIKPVTVRHHATGIIDPPLIKCFMYALYFGLSVYELFPDILEKASNELKSIPRS